MDRYEEFILKKKKELEENREQLERQERGDEAAFCKIRSNICCAFLDVWHAVQRQEEPTAAYRQKLVQIPENWYRRLAEADKHNDVEAAVIERIKLETADMLAEEFERLVKEAVL